MTDERRIAENEREVEPDPEQTEAEDDVELHGKGKVPGGTVTSPVEGGIPS